MKLAMLVYFASISESFAKAFGFLSITLIFCLSVVMLMLPIIISEWEFISYKKYKYSFDDREEIKNHNDQVPENRKLVKKWFFRASIFAGVCGFFAISIPSEKTIYIMAGAYATEQIASNERVQKIGSDVLQVIEGKLEKLKQEK